MKTAKENQGRPGRKGIGPVFLRILVAGLPFALLGAFLWALAWIESTLRQGVQAGECLIRAPGFDVDWDLAFRADSVIAACSGVLRAEAAEVDGRFIPFAGHPGTWGRLHLDLDRADLRPRRAGGDTGIPSLPRRGLRLPVSFRITLDTLVAHGTGLSPVRFHGISLASSGARSLEGRAGSVVSENWGPFRPRLRVRADWENPEFLRAAAEAGLDGDMARLEARLQRRDLRRGEAGLTARIASTRRYAAAWDWLGGIPEVRNLEAHADLDLEETPRLRIRGEGWAGDWQVAALDSLGRHRVAVEARLEGGRGTWSLHSRGPGRSRTDFAGNLSVPMPGLGGLPTSGPGGTGTGPVMTGAGSVTALPLAAGGKAVDTHLRIPRFTARPGSLELELRTVSGSSARLAARREAAAEGGEGAGRWRGRFSADIDPGEDWVRAFADRKTLRYRSLSIEGAFQGRTARFSTRAGQVRFHRLVADTLWARHRLSPGSYRLDASRLRHRGSTWSLGGWAHYGRGKQDGNAFANGNGAGERIGGRRPQPDPRFAFHLSHPEFGVARISKGADGGRRLLASALRLRRLPVAGLETGRFRYPRVTLSADWKAGGETGRAAWSAEALAGGDTLETDGWGFWTRDSVHLSAFGLELGNGTLRAGAAVARDKDGWKEIPRNLLTGAGTARLSLEAEAFPIGGLISALRPGLAATPRNAGGILDGRLVFTRREGFQGALRMAPGDTGDGPWRLERMRLAGDGDTLRLEARTASSRWPLLLDGVEWQARIAGFPGLSPEFRVRAVSDTGLTAVAEGRVQGWRTLESSLQVSGTSPLPGTSARLTGLDVRGTFSAPLDGGFLEGLEGSARPFRGELLWKTAPVQAFSGRLGAAGGRLRADPLVLADSSGDSLRGSLEWRYAGRPGLSAHLSGERYSLLWDGDRRVSAEAPEARLGWEPGKWTAHFRCGRCRGEYARGPLRASAEIKGLRAGFEAGDSARGNRELTLSGTLEDSFLGVQARSLRELQFLAGGARNPSGEGGGGGDRTPAPLRIRLDLQTDGGTHRIDSRFLDFEYGGRIQASGVLPNPTVQGKLSAHRGRLGLKGHAYDLEKMEFAWPGVPLKQGMVAVEARKTLATDCRPVPKSTCEVRMRLDGNLAAPVFRYGSDCLPALGPESDLPALVSSVSKECRQRDFYLGGVGWTYGERILKLFQTLLGVDPFAGDAGSGAWITSGNLPERMRAMADTVRTARALDVSSPELGEGFRFRVRSDYLPAPGAWSQPWDQSAALTWHPRTEEWFSWEEWGPRLENNVLIEAAVGTERPSPVPAPDGRGRAWIGLGAGIEFWGWPEAWTGG